MKNIYMHVYLPYIQYILYVYSKYETKPSFKTRNARKCNRQTKPSCVVVGYVAERSTWP